MLETKKNRQDVESCVQYVYSSKAGGGGGKDSGIQRNTKRFRENDELRQAVWNYTASNVAVVNVYFNEINVQRLVRKEAYTISAFMGAIGGLLSLAMGIRCEGKNIVSRKTFFKGCSAASSPSSRRAT